AGTGDNAPRVALLSQPLDTSSPFFRFKTTYRPHYDRALASFPDCDDVLLWNLQGQLTESCRANLVLELGGALLTPPLTSGLLDGTFRAELLAQGVIRESELYPDDLLSARQVMLINSVRKWIPVTLLS
ncbi:MAG: aminotransferase class IV, partial [Caldilineales bacterium]|nr:aminotransferase class IV [Caldilineales bacterium]